VHKLPPKPGAPAAKPPQEMPRAAR